MGRTRKVRTIDDTLYRVRHYCYILEDQSLTEPQRLDVIDHGIIKTLKDYKRFLAKQRKLLAAVAKLEATDSPSNIDS